MKERTLDIRKAMAGDSIPQQRATVEAFLTKAEPLGSPRNHDYLVRIDVEGMSGRLGDSDERASSIHLEDVIKGYWRAVETGTGETAIEVPTIEHDDAAIWHYYVGHQRFRQGQFEQAQGAFESAAARTDRDDILAAARWGAALAEMVRRGTSFDPANQQWKPAYLRAGKSSAAP